MRVSNKVWTVRKVVEAQDRIDPKPQYQRGEVWKMPRKQLLIDSILQNFDVPKIYLRKVPGAGSVDFEVADGQQRLRAIWSYVANEYPLDDRSITNKKWKSLTYDQLREADRKRLMKFPLVVAIVESTSKEIRELFARLQKGEKLTPPELRNSMPSALADVVRAMADNHKFFKRSSFPDTRFKHADLVAHAFALEFNGPNGDLKAPALKQMYEAHAKSNANDQAVCRKVTERLDFLDSVQGARPGCIKTKWGFVDLYLYARDNEKNLPSAKALGDAYVAFEELRKKALPNPKRLLAEPKNVNLYNYIVAFEKQAGLAKSIESRRAAFGNLIDVALQQ